MWATKKVKKYAAIKKVYLFEIDSPILGAI